MRAEPGLRVNEIFHSIQGESTWAGRPCVFVRLTGCHLRCAYCDTSYAFHEGRRRTVDDVVVEVLGHATPLVEVTGGEPLLQPHVHGLMARLCDAGRTVLVETSGACDISVCDPRVIRIMDLKTPSSGEAARNDLANLDRLRPIDEVKFVIGDRADYDWATALIADHDLTKRVRAVLMSPIGFVAGDEHVAGHPGMSSRDLAEWILADGLEVRFQLQLHKLVWDPLQRGV